MWAHWYYVSAKFYKILKLTWYMIVQNSTEIHKIITEYYIRIKYSLQISISNQSFH